MTTPSRYDLHILNTYLRAQAQPALLRNGGLILLAVLAWFWLCWLGLSRLLALRYAVLAQFSPSAQDIALRVGPYVWWTLALLLSLFMLSVLRSWARERIQRHWEQPVAPGALAPLYHQLSVAGRRVLEWVWQDREEPLTLGDLKRTATELASGRVEKFHLAQEQATAITVNQSNDPTADNDAVPTNTVMASPFKASAQRQEPRLKID